MDPTKDMGFDVSHTFYSTRNREDQFIVSLVVPGLKVIAVHPDYVWKCPVTRTEIPSIGECSCNAAFPQQYPLPSCGFDWIEEDDHSIRSRRPEDSIHTIKVSRVGCSRCPAS